MKKKNRFNVFIAFICSCKFYIIMLAIVAFVFAINFYIYGAPNGIVLYSMLMCGAVFVPFAVVGYIRFAKTHEQLEALKKNEVVRAENLPNTNNLLMKDYQQLIQTGYENTLKATADYDEMRSNLIDYYTIWVHQIKTPIAATDLLLQGALSEEQHLASEVQTELFKIDEYVDMALNYLKIENNTQSDFVFKKYSLDTIAREAVRKYAKLFIKKKIALDYQPLDCSVITDKKWLTFVIGQLLSNSLKYTNSGKIAIYKNNEEPVSFVIEDTGIGIATEDLPRIFDNGFTGGNGRKDHKATGMGLYLCKTILDKMSHEIKIESVVGKGTKAIITFKTDNIFAD